MPPRRISFVDGLKRFGKALRHLSSSTNTASSGTFIGSRLPITI